MPRELLHSETDYFALRLRTHASQIFSRLVGLMSYGICTFVAFIVVTDPRNVSMTRVLCLTRRVKHSFALMLTLTYSNVFNSSE